MNMCSPNLSKPLCFEHILQMLKFLLLGAETQVPSGSLQYHGPGFSRR